MFKQLLTQYSTMQKKSDGEFETKVRADYLSIRQRTILHLPLRCIIACLLH